MMNQIKKLSFIFLCLVFINPMCAMEKGKVPAAPRHQGSNATSTSTDDWKCPSCLEGNQDDVVTLKCRHKFHRACVKKWLSTSTEASELCPLCKEPHELGIDRIKLSEDMCYRRVCDPNTIEGVPSEFIRYFQTLLHEYDQIMMEEVVPYIARSFFQNVEKCSKDDEFSQELDKCKKLLLQNEISVMTNKQKIREEFAHLYPLLKELLAEAREGRRLMFSNLNNALKEQGNNCLAEKLDCIVNKLLKCEQENEALLSKYEFELLINKMHALFFHMAFECKFKSR
jgi:hypothetical protein